ncbi:transcription/repair factor TFIIH subunit Tfb3 [Coprinopsis cinerea okayama7|uniref:Transcription/repair factor TFIIH subunit Tfb3 n=1 Tax=Coprinopsis cinerea (strain Okayama-7 / 130 / ATCC MYA-4618 / FGSC 9003) TaxID=240176 RepID=A8NG41_COPC7|nr:transcription/repair factor TFIIH subunit Tfb3 [Coprinopsis cinerea okayama7\|eukprot:XP_001833469.2 transcription/repair factor TFIIH subunit Tfb3 [Coprinopsis cinerea okayama7\
MATRPGGWLQGRTIRKASGMPSASTTRSSTPQTVTATPNTIYGGGVKDPSGRTVEYWDMADQCPVSPCPICNKILRKLAFMPQTFEDLTVEKEVAVRRRIAKDFNKRREDFPDLRSYNDYLEEVEEITFNLINEVDIPETEARIAKYKAENAAIIELNLQREEAYARALREQEEYERREKEQRALELRRAEEEEREEKEKDKRSIIDKLETSDKDASELVAKARASAQKRTNAKAATTGFRSTADLLRTRAAQSTEVPDVPHVPIQDDYTAYEDMFVLKPVYNDFLGDAVRRDREGIMRAGGYMLEEAWERAIRSAVAGLEVPPLVGLDVPAPPASKLDSSGDVIMT